MPQDALCPVARRRGQDDLSAVLRDIVEFTSSGEGEIVTWETLDRLRIHRGLAGEDLPPAMEFG